MLHRLARLPLALLLLVTTACAAAELPRAERLRADVAWLADGEREGRRAGTPGEEEAAGWIAARLAEIGLQPAGVDGYFQVVPVPLPARDGGGSFVVARFPAAGDSLHAERAQQLAPLFCSAGGGARGPLVFCGYGIQDAERGWLDYGADEVPRLPANAIALLVRGLPPEGAGASEGQGFGHGGSLFHKVMTARRFGAAAVIVMQHPRDGASAIQRFDAASGAVASIPAVMVSALDAERIAPGIALRLARLDAEGPTGAGPVEEPAEIELVADVQRERGTARNVLALLPGRGGPAVVVGAHFDHLGRGGPGSLAPDAQGEIHHGADDNASGVAVALEVARELARRDAPPAGDVLFALWSAEELGLLGSELWCSEPTYPLERVAGKLNLDMVGRAGGGKLMVLGAGTSSAFADWMEPAGRRAGLELQVSLSATGLGGSDHQSFVKRGIPALHLFSGLHADYHRPSDVAERFEAEGAAKVATLALELIERMQAAPELPFSAPPAEERGERPRGFAVRFGSVPDYAFDGRGLALAGTTPGSPADRAGLVAGDVIVRIDDVEIATIHDFVYVLQIHKPGDVVRAVYLREGEEQVALVTLESREPE